MAVEVAAVLNLGFAALDAWDRYQAARADVADAKDDSLAELDAKIEAVFARIAEKKSAADVALDEAAKKS